VSIRRGLRNWQMLLATSLLVAAGLLLYQQAPSLLLRSEDATLSEVINASLAERMQLWGQGLDNFWQSPLWGVGFTSARTAHNLIISTLADQGLVGLMFFLGALVFLARQSNRIVSNPITDERTIWRMVLVCLVLFGLVRGQVSGAVYSCWELFWAGAFLWMLRSPAIGAVSRVRVVTPRTATPGWAVWRTGP
jgi:O-antigen ligase